MRSYRGREVYVFPSETSMLRSVRQHLTELFQTGALLMITFGARCSSDLPKVAG